jgi:hypothetical protein
MPVPPLVYDAVWHVLHAAEAQLLLVPGLYRLSAPQSVHVPSPCAALVPAAHAVCVEPPLQLEPASHVVHVECVSSSEPPPVYDCAPQTWHEAEPAALYFLSLPHAVWAAVPPAHE